MFIYLFFLLDLVQHKSGTPLVDEKLSFELLSNMRKLARRIARQPHYWVRRNQTAYSAILFGHYVNEIVRRVDPKKRNFDTFVNEEINAPLGTELYFSMSEETFESRVADLYSYPKFKSWYLYLDAFYMDYFWRLFGYEPNPKYNFYKILNDNGELLYRTCNIYEQPLFEIINTYEAHSFISPASTLKSNAQSMAKIASLIANGGEIDGVRIIGKEILEKSLEVQKPQFDHTLNKQITRTYGGWGVFNVNGRAYVGWQGIGGVSSFWWNKEYNIGFSHVKNALSSPHLSTSIESINLFSNVYDIVVKDKNIEK